MGSYRRYCYERLHLLLGPDSPKPPLEPFVSLVPKLPRSRVEIDHTDIREEGKVLVVELSQYLLSVHRVPHRLASAGDLVSDIVDIKRLLVGRRAALEEVPTERMLESHDRLIDG